MKLFQILAICSAVFIAGCKDAGRTASVERSVQEWPSKSPITFAGALDAIEAALPEEQKPLMDIGRGLPVGPRERVVQEIQQRWIQIPDSTLREYFAQKGVSDPWCISNALVEAWFERHKTGTVNVEQVIEGAARMESLLKKSQESKEVHEESDQ